MIIGDALPKNLQGDHYRFDDPEFEIEGLVARSEGSSLYLQASNGKWAMATAEHVYAVPDAIRKVYGRNVTEGDIDKVAMLVVPRIGGIMLLHIGMMPPEQKLRETIYEEDLFIGIPGTSITSPYMKPATTIEVRISDELSQGTIYTATADGTPLS
jgi:hypothetical protein